MITVRSFIFAAFIIGANSQFPDWFAYNTKLCYDWSADGDGGQCAGPSNSLCAGVNDRTPNYRDDTDNRGGGCQMSWRIDSPNAPDWFKQVQICYRWYADGDNGQCGDHSGRGEVCAYVGQGTQNYRDDTDKRPGGCRMSWKLKVPPSAESWMFNTRLCYSWYADGDGGQCGGGAGNDLCARANYWTDYYRDDTDGRPGGCQMSWSLLTN